MERKCLLKCERKDLLAMGTQLRCSDENITFKLNFIKFDDHVECSLSISPKNDKMLKAIESSDNFVLFEDNHYAYSMRALGYTKYIDTERQYLNGIINLYNTDTFIVNGNEVLMQQFVKNLKFDARTPVSIYDF